MPLRSELRYRMSNSGRSQPIRRLNPGEPSVRWPFRAVSGRPGKATLRLGFPLRFSRGVTLAAALICLLIVMLFASVVVRALAMRQRASRWDERQLQCLFLVESAVGRAKVRLKAEPTFTGESWTVSLDDRGVTRPGVAEIRIAPVDNDPQRRRIEIEARWPDDPIQRVQRKKELTIILPTAGAGS